MNETHQASTLRLVRPELRQFLESSPFVEMNVETLAAARSVKIPYPPSPEIPHLAVEERHVPGPEGAPDVRVFVYRPMDAPTPMPAILHMHPGGFILGEPEMCDAANRVHASSLGVVIVSVDYRHPPEHPFPAPLEDCYAALRWLHTQAEALGVDRSRIAVKGESAGGGLAAGLTLLARDRGEFPIAFQCLTFPELDDRPQENPNPFVGKYVWTAPSNHFSWTAYLGREPGGDDVSPYAAPARAQDLAGLPPALIVTVGLDLFLEENIEYARRLMRAGVAVELIVYPGTYHAFHMAGDTEINRRSEHDIRAALLAALVPI